MGYRVYQLDGLYNGTSSVSLYVISTHTHTHTPCTSSVAILGPAVTPRKRMNMGYRVYTVDGPYNATTSVCMYVCM